MVTRYCGPELGFLSSPTPKDYASENRKLRIELAAAQEELQQMIANAIVYRRQIRDTQNRLVAAQAGSREWESKYRALKERI